MNLIVCEGKTDAIFLSYYLCKKYSWIYDNKKSRKKILKFDETQDYNVYKNKDRELAIWSLGGCSKFEKATENIQEYITSGDKESYDKIIYVIDRDENDDESKIIDIFDKEIHKDIGTKWRTFKYKNEFGKTNEFSAAVLILPKNQNGALETKEAVIIGMQIIIYLIYKTIYYSIFLCITVFFI